jgi:type VI secretion system protein ImpL
VIVKDRVAMAASGFSSRVNLLRRLALGFVALGALVAAIGFLISFVGNHALESKLRTATEELRTVPHLLPSQLPSLGDLQKLERLRQELVTLSSYQVNGVPFRLRWGLYVGDRIYPDAKKIYFERFRTLLFDDTQSRLLNRLSSLPAKPGPNDIYANTYNELKAYLITTSNHEKSTKDFLSPVLVGRWTAGRDVGADRESLAKSQFDFYSTELTAANPFSPKNDTFTVERTRVYLRQFGGIDRYYLPVLDEVSRKIPSVSFNEQYADSVGVIDSSHRVQGAFTRNGFASMQEAIRNYHISAEDWVLGKLTASELDQATLQQKLTERYYQDYIREWNSVLTKSHVSAFKLSDAHDRLDKITSSASPMLELLWFIAQNTDVGMPGIKEVFAPVQAIEKSGPPDQPPPPFINSDIKPYIGALNKLQEEIDTYLRTPDQSHSDQVLTLAGAARSAAKDATSGPVDRTFHTEDSVRQLLEEPIKIVEDKLTRGPVETLNAAGQGFCQKFDQLHKFYPFNPKSTNDLPIDELNTILAPGKGALWNFYNDAKLSTYLTKEGSRYTINSVGPTSVKITSDFLNFFNETVALTDALYPQASAAPHFSYTLKQLPSNVEGLVLKVGTETLSGTGQEKTFIWTGGGEAVQVTTQGGDTLQSYNGAWAIFRFVGDAHSQLSGQVTNLEWILQNNGRDIILPNGKRKSYMYELRVNGINPFRTSELSGLRCVSTVAK